MDFIAGLISALLSINTGYTQRLICNCISALYMANHNLWNYDSRRYIA